MKSTCLIISTIILLGIKTYSQNFWERIESPTSKKLISVVFIDSLNGWIASDSGLIFRSSDGGKTWENQFDNDTLTMVNLFFLNEQVGWASAVSNFYEPFGTYLLRTTDGGLNWSKEHLRIGEAFINYVYFLDTLKGFIVGYPGFFLRTSDGGTSWHPVNLDSSSASGFPPYAVKFLDSLLGFAAGGVRDLKGVAWKTTDGGLNWETVIDTLSSEPLFAIHIFDSLNTIIMGGDPEYGASIVKTTDGGAFWTYHWLGILWYPVEMGFRTPAEGWAPMGPKREFLFTSDLGSTWSEITTPDSVNVTNICFPDSLHGYAVGNNGAILKYVYQKPNAVNVRWYSDISFDLSQNYPNPFNPSTQIKYSIPEAAPVQLKIFDVLGREIKTLVDEYKTAGRYTAGFNAGRLPAGVYFYKLQAGKYSQVKKMILLK